MKKTDTWKELLKESLAPEETVTLTLNMDKLEV